MFRREVLSLSSVFRLTRPTRWPVLSCFIKPDAIKSLALVKSKICVHSRDFRRELPIRLPAFATNALGLSILVKRD